MSNSVESNPGSFGRKVLLGIFATRKEEFVYLTTESNDGAGGIVFKTKDKTSPAIIGKIRFLMKRPVAVTAADKPAP